MNFYKKIHMSSQNRIEWKFIVIVVNKDRKKKKKKNLEVLSQNSLENFSGNFSWKKLNPFATLVLSDVQIWWTPHMTTNNKRFMLFLKLY